MRLNIFFHIFILLWFLTSPSYGWERESFYSDQICSEQFRGAPTTLGNGLKPDCETAFAVIEFDWAKSPKHYECIGQAMTYGYYTEKTPVCVLMAKTEKERKFAEGLRHIFLYSDVELKVFLLEP